MSAGQPRGGRSAWGRRRRRVVAPAGADESSPSPLVGQRRRSSPSPLVGEGRGGGSSRPPCLELRLRGRDGGPERLGDRGAAFQPPRPEAPPDLVCFGPRCLPQPRGEGRP